MKLISIKSSVWTLSMVSFVEFESAWYKTYLGVLHKLAFTCSKSTIETPEKACNMVKVNNKNNRDINDVVILFLLLTLNIFHTFF